MVEVGEWSRADTARLLRVPTSTDDKYSRGVVALRTGSNAYPGAAVLGVEAAWRAGAGYVRFVGDGRAADAVIARRPETVAASDIGSTRVDAWVIGSGTDAAVRSAEETHALQEILAGTAPVVVDAGALDLIAGASAPMIATPHAGEFARVREWLGLEASQNDERATAVADVARALSVTVLLKGATTLISSPKGAVTAVQSGPGWLATAGTGDVLAGLIGAVTAANPGAPLADTAAAGAWLHGYAAVVASGTYEGRPGHPIVALDVAEALPEVIGELLS